MSRKKTGGMLVPPDAERFALCSHPPVLQSERAEDYDALLNALARDVGPRGYIEQMYVSDFAHHIWEIMRLRRCKTAIVKGAFRAAIRELLDTIKQWGDVIDLTLAEKWCTQKARDEVRKLLARSQLDESAIEAEAYRLSSRDLENLDKMLMAFEMRRDKALACIAGYRQSFAHQLNQSADKTIEQEASDLPRVEDAALKTAAE